MPTEVIMPKVDMDMAKGKIMTWHVAEGESVAKGDPLFDIETDKAAMEVESSGSGILHHTAPEGTEVPIGTPCAWLYAEGEEVGEQPAPFGGEDGSGEAEAKSEPDVEPQAEDDDPAEPESEAEAAVAPATAAGGEARETPARKTEDGGKVRATPRARSLAAEAALDLAAIVGRGPRDRVQAGDVETAVKERHTRTPAARSEAKTETPCAPGSVPASFSPQSGALSVTRTKGGTGDPVVLLHGFASDATSWAAVEMHLKHRPLIRIDMPCHGKSPRREIDGFEDLVREMRRAFDDLGTERAHLVGHSLGGAVALALADTRARKLASLSLIAPAGLGPEVNGAALNGICAASRAESLGPWLSSLVANEDIVTDSYVRTVMSGRKDPRLRAAQTAMADTLFPDGVQAFDLRAALDRIDLPTALIWGRRDAILPWKHALRAPGRVALHLFDGVGHMPQIECPDAVGAVIGPRI